MSIQKSVGKDTVLWRYMDLSKLLDILVNKTLVFPRFDKFEDPYEGFANNYLELTKQAYMNNPFMVNAYDGYCETGLTRNLIKIVNLNSYVGCWHMNDYESAAMWKLYCNSYDSIAIKTTVGKLNYSLLDHINDLSVGGVTYDSSYKHLKKLELINIADPLFTKREAFEHEREFRIVWHNHKSLKPSMKEMEKIHKDYHNLNISQGKYSNLTDELKAILESGAYYDLTNEEDISKKFIDKIFKEAQPVARLSVNPLEFIDEIVISPDSPNWFVDTVKLTIEKLGYEFPIHKSKLYELN